MLSIDYAFYHVERLVRMIRGDENALYEMDITAEGFWKSFSAIVFALPAFFFAWVTEARDLAMMGVQYSMISMVLIQAFVDLIVWLVPVAVFVWVLKLLDLSSRYSHLIITRNWMSLFFAYVYVVLDLPSFFVPGFELPLLIIFVVLVLMLFLATRFTRIALDCNPALAAVLVVGEFFLVAVPMVYFYSAIGFYADPAS